MALGIDHALSAAAAGLKLSSTLVEAYMARKKSDGVYDPELFIEEIRVSALQRLEDADVALRKLEPLLVERGINLAETFNEVIDSIPWLRWCESRRLKRIRRRFSSLADAAYESCNDIAAIVKCRDITQPLEEAVATARVSKHRFNSMLLSATSVKDSIAILRAELRRQKELLN